MGGRYRFKARRSRWIETTAKLLGYKVGVKSMSDRWTPLNQYTIIDPKGNYIYSGSDPSQITLRSKEVERHMHKEYGVFWSKK